jgi:hypothetical protein
VFALNSVLGVNKQTYIELSFVSCKLFDGEEVPQLVGYTLPAATKQINLKIYKNPYDLT